jgi:hypothetical protein
MGASGGAGSGDAGGTAGSAGAFGTAGASGTAGDFGAGGDFGFAGSFGLGGDLGIGGDFGTAGVDGTAGTGPASCVEGTNTCADPNTGQLCSGGSLQTFNCPMGCFNGICAECVPGSSSCESDQAVQVCTPSGIWQPAQTCDVACREGVCVTSVCTDGETRCTNTESQQTCVGGEWAPETSCEFVCVGDACGKIVRHVFATSQAFVAGEIGGLTGGDDICRNLATSAGLASSYEAWLGDDTGSPATRFPRGVGPYVLVDGTVVANNWTELTSGMLRHPIDLDEMGGTPAQSTGSITRFTVWTGTTASGTAATPGGSCNDWSNSMGSSVTIGSTALTDQGWASAGFEESDPGVTSTVCGTAAAFFCFEQ